MNKFIYLLLATFIYFLILPSLAVSQEKLNVKNIDRELLMKSAFEMVKETEFCALITKDSLDRTHIRTMHPFPPENDLSIWMGTNVNSRKVSDIKNNPEAILFYGAEDHSGYVVLYGKAKLVNDTTSKKIYWREEWKDFYPDKSTYTLINFKPDSLEILNTTEGITGDAKTWRAPSTNIE